MIVGRGLLADAFRARYEADASITIFASGVSNSSETDEAQFARERDLLEATLIEGRDRFVYFSSCVVGFDHLTPSPYVRHKRRMEERVLARSGGFVFRLPQVVGRTHNPHTLTNYMVSHIVEGREFTIYDGAERNLVDIDDIAVIVPELLADPGNSGRPTVIAARYPVTVPRLVSMLEELLGKRARARLLARNERFHVDATASWAVAERLGLDLDAGDHYALRVLRKYYG